MHDSDSTRTTGESSTSNYISRRGVLQGAAGATALALGAGAGFVGSAAGGIATFQDLSVSTDNRIVNESGETFKMRGLNIPDPKRLQITKNIRGKDRMQIIDMLTNNANDWHPRVIRIPAQPTDIGEHPNGNTGPEYGSDHPAVQDGDFPADRARQRPPQPQAFTQAQLDSYLTDHFDPVVQRCKERGVYCIVDFHRHWHEQPPGDGAGPSEWTNLDGDAEAENHVAYNSEWTLYWAKNTYYGNNGEDVPGSWGYIDQKYRNEEGNASGDLSGTPYAFDSWVVNQDLVDECVMFWDTVAQRYADEPHVIFEPYNEPTAPGIWGPVSGCGGAKQQPLWDTFREEFAQPILNQVREHAPEKLILMGLPGWCQATQALHWGGFDEASAGGFSNIAAVWHNYAGHGVSEEENWLNDTTYASACDGWEPYESQGLQDAMDVHPVAVTEFGWQEPTYTENNIQGSINISKWLRGSTTGVGTTQAYGQPFMDAMETDDRLSWVAWCADPRWLTAMFKVDFTINETSFDLVNGSWYETPESEYPIQCETLPCDWALWQDPNMGQHVKDRLLANKDDLVPFATENITGGANADGGTDPTCTDGTAASETVAGGNPRDLDGDGVYMDVNGNCRLDNDDVVTYFEEMNSAGISNNVGNYDYNGNGRIDFDDLVTLFEAL